MILAVMFSLSRGGILSMVLTAILLALILPFSTKGKIKFFAVFGVLILGYVLLLGIDTIVTRFDTISDSGGTRLNVYRYSLPMLMDHWLTGIGMGSFYLLSPIYLKGFPETIQFWRVHNEYLELFLELGVPMAILFFSWIFSGLLVLVVRLRRALHHSRADLVGGAIAAACLCGLLGFLFHGLADFGWRLPVNLVYAVTLLAIAISCLYPAETQETTPELPETKRGLFPVSLIEE